MYQQVLDQGSLAADGSEEQTELRLSGLVVERDGYLKVNNRIYGSVFDSDWVKQELARLRPYSEAFTAWVESGCKDEARLLRGVALENAQAWARGKSLSDLDYQFLAAGQELDRRVLAEESRILAKANDTLTEAQQKAKRTILIGGISLGLFSVVAIIIAMITAEKIQEAKTGARLEQQGVNILRRLPGDNGYYGNRELLYSAMETGQQLFNIVKDGRPLDNYPAISPIYALQQSLSKFREKRIFRGHQDWVRSVSFSPDGKTLATASADNTVRVWDLQGNQLALLKGHQGSVRSVSFSPDGKMLATASDSTMLTEDKTEDTTVRVWDLQGNPLAVLRGHEGWVRSVSFSPDGKTLATASDKTVRVWDLEGNQLALLKGHRFWVNSVSFSRDGKTLATASFDNTIILWDLQGNPLVMLRGHQDSVNSLSFNRNGKRLATASSDSTIRLWDLQGNPLAVLRGHQGSVNSLSFSPDGKTLATASSDRTVRLWNSKGNQLALFQGYRRSVNSVSFSPDGKALAMALSDGTVRFWDLQGNRLGLSQGYQDRVNRRSVISISFSSDAKMLATESDDHTVRLWDLQGNRLVLLKGYRRSVNSVSFSRDGKTLATVSYDKTVRLWDLQGKQLALLKGHQGSIESVSFSRDGKTLATASEDKTVRLWDLQGNPLAVLRGHQNSVISVRFSRDGQMLATASEDKTVRLWDLQGNPLAVLRGHQPSVKSISFSRDGKTLATASYDKTVRLWDLQGNQLALLKGHEGSVNSVSFSRDGKTLATASEDKTVRLWDLQGNPLAVLRGHQNSVISVRFSRDGQMLATASEDKTVRLWDLQGNPLAVLRGHQPSVKSVSFSPDGKMLATTSGRTVRLRQVEDLGEMLARGCKLLEDYFVENFEALETLTTCQDLVDKVAVSPGLVKQGETLAKEGDVDGAIAKFQKAKEWNPELELNPEIKAKQLAAPGKVKQGDNLAKQGKIAQAISTYKEAQQLDPNLEISSQSWNYICYFGSLHGYATNVMDICEKAVAKEPENGLLKEGRGLARALTGDTAGAISDFQAFLEWIDQRYSSMGNHGRIPGLQSYKKQQQQWIDELRAGKNPFTEEVLKSLRVFGTFDTRAQTFIRRSSINFRGSIGVPEQRNERNDLTIKGDVFIF
ncbi:WD-40 repeat-containing protein [Moorena producens 3L]|uniref:WD-40 repeat-containing protein n=1 Tax=Moorena producens 3L TaxID=489825 RepID=F4XQ36_9CYAN|nr:WD-40 repeat-containing protein [Moorena producens 3L]